MGSKRREWTTTLLLTASCLASLSVFLACLSCFFCRKIHLTTIKKIDCNFSETETTTTVWAFSLLYVCSTNESCWMCVRSKDSICYLTKSLGLLYSWKFVVHECLISPYTKKRVSSVFSWCMCLHENLIQKKYHQSDRDTRALTFAVLLLYSASSHVNDSIDHEMKKTNSKRNKNEKRGVNEHDFDL